MDNHHRQGIANLSELCAKSGIKQVVISPGSRNAPLIFSFVNHPEIECYSIIDERSAAYFALGLALYSGKPVGIICTSGTAALNFAPAVAEAFYQRIPLIIFTADRPEEWIDQLDGQTINQHEIYRNFVHKSFNLPVETVNPDDLWFFNRTVCEAINRSQLHAVPCHINIPLREPLYDKLPPAQQIIQSISAIPIKKTITDENISNLKKFWNNCSKILIVCGFHKPDNQLHHELTRLNQSENIVIVAENLSNIKTDRIIESPEILFKKVSRLNQNDYKPDLLITIGGSVISKSLKQYLRANKPEKHWNIDPAGRHTDTFTSLTEVIQMDAADFLQKMDSESHTGISSYKSMCLRLYEKSTSKAAVFIRNLEKFTDLWAIHIILKSLENSGEPCTLHLSNSMTVRYSQLFPSCPGIKYFCNRGTSGIDGSSSTAAGYSLNDKDKNYLITGDLAFLYDTGVLQHNTYLNNLCIIILNNSEGNIFKVINQEENLKGFEAFFTTPQKVQIEFLSMAYNFEYQLATDKGNLSKAMNNITGRRSGNTILEVRTNPEESIKSIKTFYNMLNN